MATEIKIQPESDRELVLCRLIDASPEACYRAWTDPRILVEWFCPKPWTLAKVEQDVRAGGRSLIVMRSPEGQEFPNPGQFLEVVPNRKLAFTDAYLGDWKPSEKPFMSAVVTFEPAEGGKTRYTARVRHWSVADRETHEKMGFHQGWGICADQLEETARRL